ncbi:superoxide dismutase [Pseudobacillus wudalianchiensis]|uniref:superoxide dismutase n=1 Tax=Pseudobacillus wudalianchiensis TaxID=1743143 RepID=A0A1B9ATC9_9BACI|nr:superoxide dismutase [Bacillus wudalianchiensis]OCA87113.1 superoxide dismutase [Bacillus wudalianchiensis]
MEKYFSYLKEAKKWCDALCALQHENLDLNQVEKWKERVERINNRLLKVEDEEEVHSIQEEIQALDQEWWQLHERLFAEKNIEEKEGEQERAEQVPIGGHQLPPLPYAYNALEPYIDEATMRLHHDRHHKGYVDGLNRAELELQKARNNNDFRLVKHWERELAFNGAGHYLHSIFWKVMCPHGGGKPSGELNREIARSFGSFDQFKNHFSKAAENVEGGGWSILVWAPQAQRLEILQAEKHQNLSQWDVVPLLVLDVWEHAYYLKYQNKRADYINNWWNIVCWDEVNRRFQEAKGEGFRLAGNK